MATKEEARQAILDKIADLAPNAHAGTITLLAEAYAWAVAPNQPHGGRTTVEK